MNQTKKKRIAGAAVRWILTVLLTICLLLGLLSGILSASLCRRSVLIGAAEKSDYLGSMKAYLAEKYSALSTTSGIDRAVSTTFLEDYLTPDLALLPMEQIFSGETGAPDLAAGKELLLERITEYAKGMQESGAIEMSDAEWESVLSSFGTLCDYYISEMRTAILLRGIYGTLGALIGQLNRMLPFVLGATALLSLASLFLIWKIGSWYHLLLSLYASLGAGGILLAGVPAWLLAENYLGRLGLQPAYFKSWLVMLGEGILKNMMLVGGAAFFGALLCGAAILFKKKKNAEKTDDKKIQNENTAN